MTMTHVPPSVAVPTRGTRFDYSAPLILDWVTVDPATNGEPMIRGTSISANEVARAVDAGRTDAELLEQFWGLPPSALPAIREYASFPNDVRESRWWPEESADPVTEVTPALEPLPDSRPAPIPRRGIRYGYSGPLILKWVAIGSHPVTVRGTTVPANAVARAVEEGRSDAELLRLFPGLPPESLPSLHEYAKIPPEVREFEGLTDEEAADLDAFLEQSRRQWGHGRPESEP